MARYSYIQSLSVTLTANGSGSVTFAIPNRERIEILGIRQQSAGAFDIIGIRSGSSRRFSNASSGQPLDGAFIADNANNNNGFMDFPEALMLEGNDDFIIDLKDTSGSENLVELALILIKDVPD